MVNMLPIQIPDGVRPVGYLSGHPVYLTTDLPKMQLSEDCPVTPEFRIEINLWMRDFFGTDNLVPDGQCLTVNIGIRPNGNRETRILMNARTFRNVQYTFRRAQEVDVFGQLPRF